MLQRKHIAFGVLICLASTSAADVLKPNWIKTSRHHVKFSRNGRLAMFHSNTVTTSTIFLWDPVANKPLNFMACPGQAPYEPTADGKGFYYTVNSGYTSTIWEYNIAKRMTRSMFTMPADRSAVDIAVSRDGKIATISANDFRVFVYDTVTQTAVADFPTAANNYQIEFVDGDRKIATSGVHLYQLNGTYVASAPHTYYKAFSTDNNGRYVYTKGWDDFVRCLRGSDLQPVWSGVYIGQDVPAPIGGTNLVMTHCSEPPGHYKMGALTANTGAFQGFFPYDGAGTLGVSPAGPKFYWQGSYGLNECSPDGSGVYTNKELLTASAIWYGGINVFSRTVGGVERAYVEHAGPAYRLGFDAESDAKEILAAYSMEGTQSPDGAHYARPNPNDGTTAITVPQWVAENSLADVVVASAGPARGSTVNWDGNNHLWRQAAGLVDIFHYNGVTSLTWTKTVDVDPNDYALVFGGGTYVGYREEQYAGVAPRLIVKRTSDGAEVARIEKAPAGKGLMWTKLDDSRFATMEWADGTGGATLTINLYDLSSGAAIQVSSTEYFQPADKGLYGYADVAKDGSIAVIVSGVAASRADGFYPTRIAYVRIADGKVLRVYDDQFVGMGAYPLILPNNTGFAWRIMQSLNSDVATLAVTDAPVVLMPVKVDTATIQSGATGSGTVRINRPAPAGGIVVRLRSSQPGYAAVPDMVTIAEGQRTASFPIQAGGVTTTRRVEIRATMGLIYRATVDIVPG